MADRPTRPTEDMIRERCPAVLGEIRTVSPVGRSLSTWIVTTSRSRLVAKRMSYERPPWFVADTVGRLTRWPAPPCPAFLGSIEEPDYWYALFEYVDGAVAVPPTAKMCVEATNLLARLVSIDVPASPCDLDSHWLERLWSLSFDGITEAHLLLAHLTGSRPGGPPVLAHGDFSAQNFCWSVRGLVLLDWEEMGAARAGFDAGWVLAHERLGLAFGWTRSGLKSLLADRGFDRFNLDWYEALGLLRLLYRSLTLPLDPVARQTIILRVGKAIESFQFAV